MRRPTAATLALTCMGISAGVAAFVGPPVSAQPHAERAVPSVSAKPFEAAASTPKKAAAVRYSQKARNATNYRRSEHGMVELQRADCVQRFAVKQAAAMAAKTSMYHQDLGTVLHSCGLNMAGENVAYGYPNGRAVVVAWMNSPGHRANILKPGYRLMGIAARKGSNGLWYVAQVFGSKG